MLKTLWNKYGTTSKAKAFYIIAALSALAVARGAPGAGGGAGGLF
jgi:hypothetical protein